MLQEADMPATYDQLGLKLLYPDNWQIAEEQLSQWPRSLTLQSPQTAFWSLDIYPDTEANECADEAAARMADEYEDLESEAVITVLEESELLGFDLHFYCLDFLVRAQIRAFGHQSHAYLILAQAEDREYGNTKEVFDAITLSLLRSL